MTRAEERAAQAEEMRGTTWVSHLMRQETAALVSGLRVVQEQLRALEARLSALESNHETASQGCRETGAESD